MLRIFPLCAIAGLALLAVLALPEQALAWGPGVHMVTGNWVLQNLTALPAQVAGLLMLHPGQFLHGALSADIFIGKGSKTKKGHSHNWSSGFSLLDKADSPQKKAYAYGYLAHLAADTVAHNVFVPGLFHTAPGSGRFAHVYLEIQADRLLSWDSSDALGVFREKESPKAAALLCASMRQKQLPFWLKTRLYQGSIAVGGTRVWRNSMHALDALLPQHERTALLTRMLGLSTRAIVNLLQEREDSPLLSLDPVGARALALAGTDRRGKHLFARGVTTRMLRALPGGYSAAKDARPELSVTVPHVLEALSPACTPQPPAKP